MPWRVLARAPKSFVTNIEDVGPIRAAYERAMACNARIAQDVLDTQSEILSGQTRLVGGMTFNQRLAGRGYVTPEMGKSRLAAAMEVNPAAVEAEIARRRGLVSNAPRRGRAMPPPPVSNRPRRGEPLPPSPATNAANTFAAYAPYVATALGGGLMGAGIMSYLNNSRHGRTSAELFNQYPYGVY
mgnify:CR=1 FL=1